MLQMLQLLHLVEGWILILFFLQKTMLLYIFLYLHRKDMQVIIFICFISQHFYLFIFVFAHNHLEIISFVQIEIKRVAE